MKQIFALLAFFALSSNQLEVSHTWQTFAARNLPDSLQRPIIYRAIVPSDWKRIDPNPELSIEDTTQAISEFWIIEDHSKVRITVHTFPINEFAPRIPARAQIQRWKDQFDELDPLSIVVLEESHGGFTGLFLEASGIYQNQRTSIKAWSMQLALEFEKKLSWKRNPLDVYKLADFTIKATGDSLMIEKYKSEIMRFGQSFELIEELPHPI